MGFLTARKKAGLTQDEAAKALNISGAAVCQWETGKNLPDARKLPQIAKLYGCTVDELLTGEEENPPA